ncbi:hypothetical protein [Citricoccus nitrophenolicus]|uniref:hypothetical protein n=1 Tax=Citricoccus nitrophenolicus TaxID=863575 RepID=UPI0039B416BD
MSSPTFLRDLQQPHIVREVAGAGGWTSLEKFAALPEVAALGWPLEVVQQWLYDHLEWGEFLRDYAALDLSAVVWTREYLPLREFLPMTSGSTDDYMATVPDMHEHWTHTRRFIGVPAAWEDTGTWLVPPLLLDLGCLGGSAGVLQVVEGRTRVGILQGRTRDGLNVAGHHAAWVGRPC